MRSPVKNSRWNKWCQEGLIEYSSEGADAEMRRLWREEEILLDATGRKNGRGAYLCRDQECLLRAVRNKGLERSLGMKIPEEIYENLKKEMDALEQ